MSNLQEKLNNFEIPALREILTKLQYEEVMKDPKTCMIEYLDTLKYGLPEKFEAVIDMNRDTLIENIEQYALAFGESIVNEIIRSTYNEHSSRSN